MIQAVGISIYLLFKSKYSSFAILEILQLLTVGNTIRRVPIVWFPANLLLLLLLLLKSELENFKTNVSFDSRTSINSLPVCHQLNEFVVFIDFCRC